MQPGLSTWPVLWLGLIVMIAAWVAMEVRGPAAPSKRSSSPRAWTLSHAGGPLAAWDGIATAGLLIAVLGTTAFDAVCDTHGWTMGAQHAHATLETLGIRTRAARDTTDAAGLAACIGLSACVYLLGIQRMARAGHHRARELARTFAPSLVPLTLAYLAAHYILGRARVGLDAPWSTVAWCAQILVLLSGYVAAVALVRARIAEAFSTAEQARVARRSMLAATMTFTTVGLWLLASPVS